MSFVKKKINGSHEIYDYPQSYVFEWTEMWELNSNLMFCQLKVFSHFQWTYTVVCIKQIEMQMQNVEIWHWVLKI